MNSASYSRRGYLRIKKESVAGTAVITDELIEILSEGIAVNWDMEQVGGVAGSRSKNLRTVPAKVGPFEGDIEILVESRRVGDILNGLLGEDAHVTKTAGVSELSTFEPKTTVPTYTLDVARAGLGYINRFFGVRFVKGVWSLNNNILKCTLTISAQRVFTNARLTAAKAAGTELLLDQTSGLIATDSLLVLDKDAPGTTLATLTVGSVTDENTLVVSTIGASLEIDDVAVIAAATIDDEDYDRSKELTFAGGAEAWFGKWPDATQRLIARTNLESFELTITNDYEPRWAATGADVVDRMPATIQMKGVSVSGKVSQFHTNPELTDILRSKSYVGMRVRFLGLTLEANVGVAATGALASDGVGTVTATADAVGEAGNDYAIRVVQGTGSLSAALSGKMITVTLDATPANNTVALVASAIAGLTGVTATSTGAGNVTTTTNPDKVIFAGGIDASAREMLEFDLPKVAFKPFTPNLGADDVIMDEVEFDAQRDEYDGREIRVRLRNNQAAY